eukprot:TRINITY_DN12135_c0_g1_i1.p1 TRINITY_DN12135_c0_g1~~TRINITY_DN12135_c0_g1_i1.p1  ORF type:complete len:400 (+),score=69.28 TRINITY_DN12135_c0_g1_i1:285-1484(+)
MQQQYQQQRPSSGSSNRSRRDEVWEMKRQRFFARQAAGGCSPSGSSAGYVSAPTSGQRREPSPLSRLVAGGYPVTSEPTASTHQPYGERPSSGGAGMSVGSGGGFDAGVAGQWNANVQRDLHNRQNRSDPNIAGPHMPAGGQKVTQAPGGVAAIDLSWNTVGQVQSAHPPRIPSGGSVPSSAGRGPHYGHQQQQQQQQPYYNGGGGSCCGAGGGGGSGGSPPYQNDGGTPSYQDAARCGGGNAAGSRQQASSMRGVSPAGSRRGGNVGGASPWGRDDDVSTSRQTPSRQREAPPFGVDDRAGGGAPAGAGARGSSLAGGGAPAGAGARGSSRARDASRGASPSHAAFYGAGGGAAGGNSGCGGGGRHCQDPSYEAAPAGMARGRAAGRPPGGGSSLVLG